MATRRMKRRYHLRLPFFVYCGLTVLLAVAAMNGGSNLLFWIFGVLASALLISGAVSGVMMVGLRVRRVQPGHGVVGEPCRVQYSVRNRNRLLPVFNIRFDEISTGQRLDFSRLMEPARAWVMHIGPGETVHGEAVFRPARRGEARFDQLRIWTTFPFGIVGKSITVSQPQRMLVFPRLYALQRRVLDAIAPTGAIGIAISQRAGAGDDYYGLREFRSGDSRRHIAWKRTANRDQLVSIERTRPNPPRLRVRLDLTRVINAPPASAPPASAPPASAPPAGAGGAEGSRELEERAISLAASVVHAAELAGYEIGLDILGFDVPSIPLRRGHWHRHRIMAALAQVDLDAPRTKPGRGAPEPDAGLVVIHPDRPVPDAPDVDAWHLSARQLEHLVVGDGPEPLRSPSDSPARAVEAAA